MHYLRGYENLLCDIAEDRKEVYELADKILYEFKLPLIENNFKIGIKIDVVGFGDDWGTQTNLVINPKIWRKIFKPRYKEMFDLCHKNEALVFFHSDGMIMDIVEDLIEIGVNCLNPQFSCMDLKKLKEIVDENCCIMADIDRQNILPFGKPEDVREYIKIVFDIFGSEKGGLIWRGEINADVPIENVESMLKSFYEFRDLKKEKR